MTYLWRIPDDYPEALIGEYQREGTPDRFLFRKGERVADNLGTPIVRFNAPLARLREFDSLANNAMLPLVNARCATMLREGRPDDVQLIPARVEASDGASEEFSLVNVTAKVKCIDRDRSVFTYVPGTQQIMAFRKLEYIDGCLGEHGLARDTDYLGHLLVSEAVASRLKDAKCKGVALLKPSQIAW